MTPSRTVIALETLIEHAVKRHDAQHYLVEVVLENGESFVTTEIYSMSDRFLVFEVLATEDKETCSARVVPTRRIRYFNVYTDPKTVPQRYGGSWTVGFKVHRAQSA